jgi:hypothetical protein
LRELLPNGGIKVSLSKSASPAGFKAMIGLLAATVGVIGHGKTALNKRVTPLGSEKKMQPSSASAST